MKVRQTLLIIMPRQKKKINTMKHDHSTSLASFNFFVDLIVVPVNPQRANFSR